MAFFSRACMNDGRHSPLFSLYFLIRPLLRSFSLIGYDAGLLGLGNKTLMQKFAALTWARGNGKLSAWDLFLCFPSFCFHFYKRLF